MSLPKSKFSFHSESYYHFHDSLMESGFQYESFNLTLLMPAKRLERYIFKLAVLLGGFDRLCSAACFSK